MGEEVYRLYRIIIADDENKVCQLIRLLGDWERLQIEIVAICNDGEDALEKIKTLRPDIVLTDIRMPGRDGLELIETVKKEGIDCSFIIISGYRQFDYAHSAMQMEITDYLLKPIDKDQLNAALERICRRIDAHRIASENDSRAQKIIQENANRSKAQLMHRLLEREKPALTARQIQEKYAFELRDGQYQALLINSGLPELHREGQVFGEKVVETAQRVFSDVGALLCLPTADGVYCLLGCRGRDAEEIRGAIRELYYQIKAFEDIYGELHLVIGVSDPVQTAEQLPDALGQAHLAERTRIFGEPTEVIFARTLPRMARPQEQLGTGELRALSSALESLSEEQLDGVFLSLEKLLMQGGVEQTLEVWRLRDLVLERLQRFAQSGGCPITADQLELFRMQTDRAQSRLTLNHQLLDCARRVQQQVKGTEEDRESLPVRRAKQYVQQRYSQPLTLEEVAGYVGFSPAYFSSVFKKHTQINFSDYLVQVRIEAAKNLLRTTDQSVAEISAAVGYPDDKYFRKLFKKFVLLKPSEYRKLYS